MRNAILTVLLAILLAPYAAAFTTTSTGSVGSSPIAHGPRIAFLTFEDAIDQDLNNDGDLSDHVLQYYDTRDKKTVNTAQEAVRFALADGTAILEDKTRRLWRYDLEQAKATDTGERGTTPKASGTKVVFVTAEQDLDTDLNEDNDLLDDIIRYHDISSGKTTNTRASGTTPVINDGLIIFATNEDDINEDLNKDNDLDDNIIRIIDIGTGQVKNTRVTGKNPIGVSNGIIIFTNNKQFWTINLGTNTNLVTGVYGENAILNDDLLAYEREENIKLYRISTSVEKDIGIKGKQPFLKGNLLVFVAEDKTITFLQGEDDDRDLIPDFADNCQEYANPDQADRDRDGIGDVCDENDDTTTAAAEPVKEQEISPPAASTPITAQATAEQPVQENIPSERKPLPEPEQETRPRKKQNPAYWFLIAVALGVIGIALYFLPRWMARRKKSFGF